MIPTNADVRLGLFILGGSSRAKELCDLLEGTVLGSTRAQCQLAIQRAGDAGVYTIGTDRILRLNELYCDA